MDEKINACPFCILPHISLKLLKKSTEVNTRNIEFKQDIHKFHSAILSANPTKNLPNIEDLGKPKSIRAPQQMMVPTAAALKMGVGFPLKNIQRGERIMSTNASKGLYQLLTLHEIILNLDHILLETLMLNECGICRQRRDQHLLAKCDTCHLYYHLDCLNPPLSRLPKKSKQYGWQCSECDKTSDSEVEEVKTPRRSRSRYSREYKSEKSDSEVSSPPKLKIKPVAEETPQSEPASPILHVRRHSHSNKKSDLDTSKEQEEISTELSEIHNELLNVSTEASSIQTILDPTLGEFHKSAKKRRREKHRNRYSPDLGISNREHKRKRKKKSIDVDEPLPHPRITIKVRRNVHTFFYFKSRVPYYFIHK